MGLKKICCCWVLLFFSVSSGMAENIWEVETGEPGSASWEFVEEFSQLWNRKFPDQPHEFIPKYSSSFEKRFENLEQRKSRFVIAPLTSWSVQQARVHPVRVAIPLWDVYLAVLSSYPGKKSLSLRSHDFWYAFPQNQLILDFLTDREFPELIPVEPAKLPDVLNENEEEEVVSDEDVSSDELANSVDKTDSAKEASSAFLIEMVGPVKNLKSTFGDSFSVLGIDRDLRSKFKTNQTWLESVLINTPNGKVGTVGFTMALFVHESEDAALIENIKELLGNLPGKYLKNSFLMENLVVKSGRKIDLRLRYYPK